MGLIPVLLMLGFILFMGALGKWLDWHIQARDSANEEKRKEDKEEDEDEKERR